MIDLQSGDNCLRRLRAVRRIRQRHLAALAALAALVVKPGLHRQRSRLLQPNVTYCSLMKTPTTEQHMKRHSLCSLEPPGGATAR
jgi:hypothetical protein